MSTEIHPMVAAGVRTTTDLLSDDELNALYLSILLEQSPVHIVGYDKAKTLFTERNETKMHHDVEVAFGAIWKERIGKQEQR